MTDYLKSNSKYFFIALFILLFYLSFLLIEPFFISLLTTLLLAYFLYPVYKILKKKIKNEIAASLILTMSVLLVIVIPLGVLINLVINEAYTLYYMVDITAILAIINNIIPSPIVLSYLQSVIENGLPFFISASSAFVLTIPQKIINFFISLIVLYYSFKSGHKLVSLVKKLIPLEAKKRDTLLKKFQTTIDGVVFGVVINAFIQATVATIGFAIFGVNAPFFWGALVGILAMLPAVGPTLVWLPLAIYKYVLGEPWIALGLTLYGLIVMTILTDIIVKPKIIGWKGKIHPVVVLLGVIGGLSLFGIIGLVLGPLILTVFLFFLDVYMGR